MEEPQHYVRPEDAPEPVTPGWWRRAYQRFYHFMFEKEPGYEPPYHGNAQGATINDPRYTPGLFNRERVDLSDPEAERIATEDDD